MSDYPNRLLTAFLLGVLVAVASFFLRLAPAGSSPLVYAALPLLSALGFHVLHEWRQAAGVTETGPVLQYLFIVAASYIILGLLLPSNRLATFLTAAASVALLVPAISEYVRDRSQFKDSEPEGEEIEAESAY